MVLRIEKEKKYIPDYWEAKPEDIRALRTSLDRALAALEPGRLLSAGERRAAPGLRRAQPDEPGARPGPGRGHPGRAAHPAPGGAARGGGPVADRVVRAPAADPARLRPGGDRRRGEGLHRARAAARRVLRPRGARVRAGPGGGRRGEGRGAAGFQRDRHRPEPGRRRRAGAVLRAGHRGRRAGAR